MTTIQMPQLGETIVEGTILKWLKREGEEIERDEPLFEISTDKVDTEVPSPVSGTVSKILVEEGQTVPVGTDLAEVSEDGQAAGTGAAAPAAEASAPQAPAAEPAAQPGAAAESAQAVAEGSAAEMPAAEPATPQGEAASTPSEPAAPAAAAPAPESGALPDRGPRSRILSPLVRRLADEHGLDLSTIEGTGTGGRITKKDVMAVIES
ncbi:MAG TPA: biotin/lipoyl-containing protein, partial [Actinomycetota bacterium]|nr:biotin/lipoyl-containing protein [Actinomycetota bacterium]